MQENNIRNGRENRNRWESCTRIHKKSARKTGIGNLTQEFMIPRENQKKTRINRQV
ncbi:MAG: hypothetical protein ACTTH5_03035 [Wolinella sp.]